MLSCQKLSFRPRAGNARAPHGCDTLEIVSWTANTPTSPRLSLRVAIAALGRCNCFVELHGLANCLISTPSTASHVMSGTLRRAGPSSSRNCMPELRQLGENGSQRPRVIRSTSACTIRSTTRGKFSSSHDFSMGRSVSRTTSSSVCSCFFTVSVNVLNAEPTAAVACATAIQHRVLVSALPLRRRFAARWVSRRQPHRR